MDYVRLYNLLINLHYQRHKSTRPKSANQIHIFPPNPKTPKNHFELQYMYRVHLKSHSLMRIAFLLYENTVFTVDRHKDMRIAFS